MVIRRTPRRRMARQPMAQEEDALEVEVEVDREHVVEAPLVVEVGTLLPSRRL